MVPSATRLAKHPIELPKLQIRMLLRKPSQCIDNRFISATKRLVAVRRPRHLYAAARSPLAHLMLAFQIPTASRRLAVTTFFFKQILHCSDLKTHVRIHPLQLRVLFLKLAQPLVPYFLESL